MIAESLTFAFAFFDVRARKWVETNLVLLINLRVRIWIWCKRERVFDFSVDLSVNNQRLGVGLQMKLKNLLSGLNAL